MLNSLIDRISAAYRADRHKRLLTAIWEQERWFDTPHQLAAAEIAREAFAEAGFSDVRLAAYAADGLARYQDWITKMAWECPAAKLWIADGGDVLADRQACQCAVAEWSGPLGSADEPVRGRVVDGDALATITSQAVAGKLVLTARSSREMKAKLTGMKPAAIVSDFLRDGTGYDENTTVWINGWSNGADGWYYHARDDVTTGFNLSAAAGKRLRQALAANPDLELAAFCDSRLYEGQGQCVTAVLEGEDPSREVWIYGHACEQGAADNCSGVASLVEAMTMLKELIDAGRLPPPRLSIRAITTEECLGMVAFATTNDELRRRALVGLNVDAVGDVSTPRRPFCMEFGPYSNPTIGWAAFGLIGEALAARSGGTFFVQSRYFTPAADDMIGDPACGVASMWLGHHGDAVGYHSSADTPEIIADGSIRGAGILTAVWAYALATMDDELAGSLVGPAGEWIERAILPTDRGADAERLRRWGAAGVLRSLGRFGVSESVYAPAAAALCEAGAAPLPGLPTAGATYERTTWGNVTLETLPAEKRAGLSRWRGWQNAALYWTDGRRPLAAVERLTAAEVGDLPDEGLGRFFALCEEAGAVRKLA